MVRYKICFLRLIVTVVISGRTYPQCFGLISTLGDIMKHADQCRQITCMKQISIVSAGAGGFQESL